MSPNIPFSARNTAFQDLWPGVWGNLDTETATFVEHKKVKKRVQSTNFFDRECPNIPFSARNTAFQDLWLGFLGKLDTEPATFVDHKKVEKRAKRANCISIMDEEIKPQTAFPVTETRFNSRVHKKQLLDPQAVCSASERTEWRRGEDEGAGENARFYATCGQNEE